VAERIISQPPTFAALGPVERAPDLASIKAELRC
jgi:hypothetical protein